MAQLLPEVIQRAQMTEKQAKQASAAQQAEDIERKGQLFEGFANSKG
jgi:hypothetical protein